ncbi:DUF4838 domain-containing protein [Phycisphaerales bacterium AB-hyl4]|uniref:DUF4838 domain-containing protein n=1 Tax=Natronomicrosphaera hydrolytica TaxID=3242702 RepID=A0ABV4U9E2_9BACT
MLSNVFKPSIHVSHRAALLAVAITLLACACPVAEAVTVVSHGHPNAIIVTADEPTEVSAFAAQELVDHVKLATGVTLEIRRESDLADTSLHHIYLGDTQSSRRQGLDATTLEPDAFLLHATDSALYIWGNEGRGTLPPQHSGAPWTASDADVAHRGTLYGVYEILERFADVRWLWPGELGTYVPRTDTLVIDQALDEIVEPALSFRRTRWNRIQSAAREYDAELGALAFSEDGLQAYARDLATFVRRHRIGDSTPKPTVGHVAAGLWQQYGNEHPEWFMMREDGTRGPGANETSSFRLRHVAMCVSNPDLHRFLVEEHWDGGDVLALGEVDRAVFCHCENCLAWDKPVDDPPHFARRLYQPLMSDRYARFWKQVYELAVQRNPDVQVTSFLYWNYMPAPTDITLNSNIYGEFVPWDQAEMTYFPLQSDAYDWLKEQWLGWKKTGIIMAYRPNHLHGGYVMPHLSTWQVGDFLRFTYQHGAIGVDHDALIGHWAVKGPMLYIHMRLAAKPELEIEQLRREYFSAFGPAAQHIEAYFDHWETYSENHPPNRQVRYSNPHEAHLVYPEQAFEEPAQMLEDALSLVRHHAQDEYAQRVRFLQAGLEHARLAARFMSLLEGGRAPSDAQQFVAAREALLELIAFRREHEHLYIADYIDAARRERRRTDADQILQAPDEVAPDRDMLPDPWGVWLFRKDPQNRGVQQRWYRSDDAADWQPIETPAPWHSTHVGDYLGYGWYRTTFTVPTDWPNETLTMLFNGVDEQAWVWVNGQQVGEHTAASEDKPISQLWDRPFEVKVPAAVLNVGQTNQLIVRVHASQNAAGIWRPVHVYAPVDN